MAKSSTPKKKKPIPPSKGLKIPKKERILTEEGRKRREEAEE
jgi:hypothetical protein